jgi:hypothetical protein
MSTANFYKLSERTVVGGFNIIREATGRKLFYAQMIVKTLTAVAFL